jgi:glycosyltransferase involved in cell wall biosynthesis
MTVSGGNSPITKNSKGNPVLKQVSIIIPCRNEEGFIDKVIENIQNQDYPKSLTEVLFVDGMSTDKTAGIIAKYATTHSHIKLLLNENKFVSHALNIGIRASRGEIIIRMDAHCEYPTDYITKLVNYLGLLKAENVGGICVTLPGGETDIAVAIARGISCSFGIGNSMFRLKPDHIMEVDTVPFGCFRRELFDRIGLFDEDLIRNQDDEFNVRIKNNKGKIYLIPDVQIIYYARNSLRKLFSMYYQYGLFKPLVVRKTKTVATLRQIIPSLFIIYLLLMVSGIFLFPTISSWLILPLLLYILISIIFTAKYVFNDREIGLVLLPVVFSSIHISYGWGYLAGLFKYLIFNKKASNSNLSPTR